MDWKEVKGIVFRTVLKEEAEDSLESSTSVIGIQLLEPVSEILHQKKGSAWRNWRVALLTLVPQT